MKFLLFALLLAIPAFAIPAPAQPEKGSVECAVCEWIVGELDKLIEENATETAIEKAIEHVCTILPKSLVQVCDSFIEEYTPILIELFVKDVPADKICKAMGLCPKTIAEENGFECTVCTWAMTQLEAYITKDTTEAQIEKLVEHVCDALPAFVQSPCKKLIEEYTPELIQMLVDRENPDTICKQLKICKTAVEAVDTQLECTVCKWIMVEIESWITKNTTEEEIIKLVENVCNLMPSTVKATCNAFVDEYGELVIDMLVQELDPNDICPRLGLCPPTAEPDTVECAVCEWVMTELEGLIEKNATEAVIERALEVVCDYLPSSVRSMCDQFVEEYTPIIIEMLVKQVKPEKVCQAIGLCGKFAPEQNTIQCAICEWAMTELESLIEKNATESQIEKALEKVCSLLPSSVKSMCDAFIEEYTPILIELLVKEVDPSKICTLIGLCGKQVEENDLKCAVCEWVMTELDNLLTEERTEEEIEKALDTVCTLLPSSVQTMCASLIKEYTPILVELLVKEVAPQKICTIIGLCAKAEEVVPTNSVGCAVCEWVLTELEGLLEKNATESQIEKAIEKVCELLPQGVRSMCDQFVDEYTPLIVDLLVKEIPPEKVCTVLGLCGKSASATIDFVDDNSVQCAVCEWVIAEVDDLLEDKPTEEEIEKVLEQVCNFLPESVRGMCDALIEEYTPVLIELLVKEVPPQKICTLIGLCGKQVQENSIECAVCEWAMAELEKLVEKNATEEAIEKALEKVCNFLPKSVQSMCDSLIDEYTPMIIEMLVKQVPPEKVCKMIKLCGSSVAVTDEDVNSIECAICEWTLAELEKLVEKNATEEAIEKALEKVCSVLPKSVQSMCDAFVEEYTPVLIELLVKQVPPAKICTIIGLCGKKEEVAEYEEHNSIECAICEWAMSELEGLIEKNATEEAIEKALEKVCSVLPKSVQSMCDAFVEEYTPVIIELLVKKVPPQKVCQTIGLCGKQLNTIQCAICEWAMTELESLIEKNATEGAIEKALEKVCSLLPSSVKSMCDAFIEEYTPILIELLVKEVDPSKICTIIGLCGKQQADLSAGGIECTICKWTMIALEDLITDKRTEEEIEKALDKVCAFLPKEFQGMCDSFVAEYAPQIIELLVKKAEPDQVCKLIHFC